MPRPIWKGSINFGLVNIPVSLHAAEAREEVSFRMLDRRNLAPVRYQRVNDKTGKEVPWEQIVKGYEHEPGEYVVLSDEELKRANVEATQSVDITGFVDAAEIETSYYYKPYYLEPLKKAHKSYALLAAVLARTQKVGVGKIVIRSKQYLAAVMAQDRVLLVELLRYAHELRKADDLDLPSGSLKSLGISDKEVKLAESLVEAMIEPWQPEKYTDTYRDDVLGLIERKVQSGQGEKIDEGAPRPAPRRAQVVDIMDLLKRSVAEARKPETAASSAQRRRKAG